MSENTFELRSIGTVHATGQEFYLEIDEAYRPALKGLKHFSHVKCLCRSAVSSFRELNQQTFGDQILHDIGCGQYLVGSDKKAGAAAAACL